MGRVIKVHGFDSPRVGRMADMMLLRWKEAFLVAMPGTTVWEYLDALPADNLEMDFTPKLFTRFTPGIEYPQYWISDFYHTVYWDSLILVGLHPGIIFAVPNDPVVQRYVLLGQAALMQHYPDWFARFGQTGWASNAEWVKAEVEEVPQVNWVHHTY
jgi:hypothetical protein